ncbi:MAG: PAS domain S-box protein [Methanobacteriaceae archaeon]|nr:PAS domain S-box protein [Methanobacteriaceae archaeon]MDP2837107.1 PAS domain S-box protein [Methanobacteriaceae archaeon]
MPSDIPDEWSTLREKIIGLGEKSIKKSYYPELQEHLNELKRFRTLLDQTNDAIFLVEVSSFLLTDLNQSAYEQLGYSPKELIKTSIIDIVAPEDRQKFINIFSSPDRPISKEKLKFKAFFIKKGNELMPMEVSTRMVYFSGILYSVMVARDISDRIAAEKTWKESEDYYRTIFENTGSATVILEKDTTISRVNTGFETLTGYSREEIEGKKSFKDFLHPEELPKTLKYHQMCRNKIELAPKEYETIGFNKNGDLKYVVATIAIIPGTDKSLVSLMDITARKAAEEQIIKSLEEKDVLLKEIHHRVKNNLQIISSLLNLQAYHIKDPADLEIFKESQIRVKSMALIHEQLYQSENLASINFAEYIKNITSQLFNSYSSPTTTITLNLDLQDVNLEIETAIPCGLIINELVSNSLKHAFKNRNKGKINISLNQDSENVVLSISDDGVGFDLGKINISDSLGLKLVKTLVNQLDGSLEIRSDEGSSFLIIFNAAVYKI